MRHFLKKKGQSVTEYLILFAVVLTVVVAFLGPNSPFEGMINKSINVSVDGIEKTLLNFEVDEEAIANNPDYQCGGIWGTCPEHH